MSRGACNWSNAVKYVMGTHFPLHKAAALGYALRTVPHNRIKDAMANHNVHGSFQLALIEIIQYWLDNELHPEWEKLAQVFDAEFAAVASRLRGCSGKPSNPGEIMEVLMRSGFAPDAGMSLALGLGVPRGKLQSIMADRGVTRNAQFALADILQAWFENDLDTSWEKLEKALDEVDPKLEPDSKTHDASGDGNKPEGENTCRNTGFSVKDTTSVVYSGKKNSLNWEKYGITLLFEDSKVLYEEDSGCPIKVSVVESNDFIYPKSFEAISTIYHIDCLKPLNATVTIRINHTVAEEDRKNLHLLCSDDKQPPYHFSILKDAQFTSAYGEIKVDKFSFFVLAKLILEFGLRRGVIAYMENAYVASLYYKKNFQKSGDYKVFYIFISVVKDDNALQNSMKEYISREYDCQIKLGDSKPLSIIGDINVSIINSNDEVILEPSESFILYKSNITKYAGDRPPHQRVTIKAKTERGWKVKFRLGDTVHIEFDSDTIVTDPEVPRIHQDSDTQGGKMKMNITYFPEKILGQGCQSMIFEGEFDGRSVAVKRLPLEFFDIADQEVELLRKCDKHANVVRYYFTEQDDKFKYIALELAQATLNDYVTNRNKFNGCEVNSVDLLEQAMKGLAHLHSIRIVHRDIKPHNVLLFFSSPGSVTAKISDFGLSKKLPHGKVSFTAESELYASLGWSAPEVLDNPKKMTFAVDIFSMGCVIYYVLTSGHYPFDSFLERQAKIKKNEYDLSKLSKIHEYTASDLLKNMISHNSVSRPTAEKVLCHCLFWSNKKQMKFFQEVSDYIDKQQESSSLCQSLEQNSFSVVLEGNWMNNISDELKKYLRKYRSYKVFSVKDLLRAIRNIKNHYYDFPEELRQSLGSNPDECVCYFTSKFTQLLIHTYKKMETCNNEDVFKHYYKADFRK